MCGRFTLSTPADVIAEVMQLAELITWEPRYNIAPTQPALAVRANDVGQRRGGLLHWGLIPSWAKDPAIGNRLINARGETLAAKPSFRSAFRRQRCLIVAGRLLRMAEVSRGQAAVLHPPARPTAVRLRRPVGTLVGGGGVAGRRDRVVHDRDDHTQRGAGADPRSHAVVLAADDYDTWLDPALQDAERLQPLLQPCPPDDWEAYPVSKAVNRPAYDEPACVERAGGRVVLVVPISWHFAGMASLEHSDPAARHGVRWLATALAWVARCVCRALSDCRHAPSRSRLGLRPPRFGGYGRRSVAGSAERGATGWGVAGCVMAGGGDWLIGYRRGATTSYTKQMTATKIETTSVILRILSRFCTSRSRHSARRASISSSLRSMRAFDLVELLGDVVVSDIAQAASQGGHDTVALDAPPE